MKICKLRSCYYDAFYALVQSTRWGDLMLPKMYNDALWGVVVLDSSDAVVGGWAGTLRGNGRLAKYFAKSVYFDTYPLLPEGLDRTRFKNEVVALAKQEDIVMLHLTHWVRGERNIEIDKEEMNATFVVDLRQTEEEIFYSFKYNVRNAIRKAQKSELVLTFYSDEEAIAHIPEFQALRDTTQQRAIAKNKNASMLTKSDEYFTSLLRETNASLVLAEWQNKIVAGATYLRGGNTIYTHMAGSDYMANKQTQVSVYYYWYAMLHFKKQGVHYFDLGGCPVAPTPEDPASGIYAFKYKFGGEYTTHIGGDLVVNTWKYRLLQWVLNNRQLLRFLSKKNV